MNPDYGFSYLYDRHHRYIGTSQQRLFLIKPAWNFYSNAPLFERAVDSLHAAISSAIADVERAGCRVSRVEMQHEAIAV